jgi:integrase
MAIYPDKKAGVLTGRYRVELQNKKSRYVKRHDTLPAARADEEAVKAAWGRGEAPSSVVVALPVSKVHSIASVTQEARGALWRGQAGEANAWVHIQVIGDILGAHEPLDSFDTKTMDRVARELDKKGLSDATVNRYLSHFRTFLEWGMERDCMDGAKFAKLKMPWRKESKGRLRWISAAEEAAIEKYLLGKGQEQMWKLIYVAIQTGCRRSELMNAATTGQITGNFFHIWKTKIDEPRTVPMSDRTTQYLKDLIVDMPSKRGLRSWWDRMALELGLQDDEHFVFHICRHTCATRMVEAGVDILVIKEWLGHKLLSTTQRYAHVQPKNLHQALLAVSDLAEVEEEKRQKTAVS